MERNIYKIGKELFITSDEEIKEGDCFIGIKVEEDSEDNSFVIVTPQNKKQYVGSGTFAWVKKITLTTDPDLIADGVQAIDDDFLEWFVKNPSCEYIDQRLVWDAEKLISIYKIIIPQEEPTLKELYLKNNPERGIVIEERINNFMKQLKPKQGTLENITLEEIFGSNYCKFSVIENKLAALYRNQEKILTAIKLLNNGK